MGGTPAVSATLIMSSGVISFPLRFTDVACSHVPTVCVRSNAGANFQSLPSYKNAKFLAWSSPSWKIFLYYSTFFPCCTAFSKNIRRFPCVLSCIVLYWEMQAVDFPCPNGIGNAVNLRGYFGRRSPSQSKIFDFWQLPRGGSHAPDGAVICIENPAREILRLVCSVPTNSSEAACLPLRGRCRTKWGG